MGNGANSAVELPDTLRDDDALRRTLTFARRYGEGHTLLAMHAALPLGLTPDLLHLIRVNFAGRAPWIAEADLLLSPLCREVGGELYEMDPGVRELLLDELMDDAEFGPERAKEVAEFLHAYAVRALKTGEGAETLEMRDFCKALEWVALAYARPEEAAQSLAGALRDGLHSNDPTEVTRIAGITQALAAPLIGEEKVLLYVGGLERLAEGDAEGARKTFDVLGPLDQPTAVGGVYLPAAENLLPRPAEEPPPATTTLPPPSPPPSPQEADWRILLERIRSGRCTLILGPGSSSAPPLGRLSEQMARSYDYPFEDHGNIMSVARYASLRSNMSSVKEEIAARLRERRGEEDDSPENAVSVLAELPLTLYLTTSYDDLLTRTLKEHHKNPRSEWCRWYKLKRGAESSASGMESLDVNSVSPAAASPLVFHLYGHVGDPESLVLTEDDHLAFLFNVAREQDVIPRTVQRSLMTDTLLFVGFSSFEDLSFRVLLRFLIRFMTLGFSKTYFIQLPPPVPTGEEGLDRLLRRFAERYFQSLRIKIFWATPAEFSAELSRWWNSYPKDGRDEVSMR